MKDLLPLFKRTKYLSLKTTRGWVMTPKIIRHVDFLTSSCANVGQPLRPYFDMKCIYFNKNNTFCHFFYPVKLYSSQIWIHLQAVSLKIIRLKIWSTKFSPFRLGLNILNDTDNPDTDEDNSDNNELLSVIPLMKRATSSSKEQKLQSSGTTKTMQFRT